MKFIFASGTYGRKQEIYTRFLVGDPHGRRSVWRPTQDGMITLKWISEI
jgi:hypothetical protein